MELLRRRRARRRRAERLKRYRRRMMIRLAGMAVCLFLFVLLLFFGIRKGIRSFQDYREAKRQEQEAVEEEERAKLLAKQAEEQEEAEKSEEDSQKETPEEELPVDFSAEITIDPLPSSWEAGYTAVASDSVRYPNEEEMTSTYAVLINMSTNQIEVQKDAKARIVPASMTKVLTILVAAEHIKSLDDEVIMTQEITDYAYSHGSSAVGYKVGEKTMVRDLFYGTILPSGADAAVALAEYVAGSHEAFVEMMNEKLAELGLSETTHFTNCVGLYDEDHYSTVYDMAMIMKAAVENDWCRQVLNTRIYTTTPTAEHPEGMEISNLFMRRIEDKDCGGEVIGGKTGFVNQSGNCAVSYALSAKGTPYICATVNAHSAWRCIYDHVAMYKLYALN